MRFDTLIANFIFKNTTNTILKTGCSEMFITLYSHKNQKFPLTYHTLWYHHCSKALKKRQHQNLVNFFIPVFFAIYARVSNHQHYDFYLIRLQDNVSDKNFNKTYPCTPTTQPMMFARVHISPTCRGLPITQTQMTLNKQVRNMPMHKTKISLTNIHVQCHTCDKIN